MSWSSVSTNPAVGTVLGVGAPYEQNIELALDSTGRNGVIAWAETGEKSMARRLVNGVWQSAETLWAAEPQTHRVIAAFVDDTGAPCVALSRGSWYFSTLHRYSGGSWSQVSTEFGGSGGAATGVDFPDATEPQVCLTINYGTASARACALAFRSRDGIRVVRNSNGSWLGATLLGSTLFGATPGAFIKVSTTEWHILGRLQDNRIAHWRTTDSGATWTAATIISDSSNLGTDVRGALLSDGSILAVWSKQGGAGTHVWARYSGGAWTSLSTVTGPSDTLTTGNVNFAAGTLTYGKSVSGVTQIMAKTFSAGAWGSEVQLTSESSSIAYHSFGATADGNEAALAYQIGTSFKIRRRVYGTWRTASDTFANANFYPQVSASSATLGVHSGLTPQATWLDATIPQQITGQARASGSASISGRGIKLNLTSTTDAYETFVGNALLRAGSMTGPSQLYAALFTGNPGESGSVATEVSGGGYARTPIAFGAATTPGVFTNNTAALFPEATSSWGVIAYIGIMSSSAGGQMLMYFPLITATGDTTTQAIGVGDRPEIAAGHLTATFT